MKPGVRNLSKLSKSMRGILSELLLLKDAVTPNLDERNDISFDHFRTLGPKPLMAGEFLNCHFDAKKSFKTD